MFFDIVKYDPVNNYLLYSKNGLTELKQKMDEKRLHEYQKDMQVLFGKPLESVVGKKISPSEDSHDYVSLATYYWPNPETENGYPYIQKDGYANPDGVLYDKDKLRRLAYLVYHGGLLLYLTEDKKYQDLIERHIEHFFINPETKMNPNMNHGQYIPGNNLGRKEGIIDYAANFTYALNVIMHLERLGLINQELVISLKSWHKEFLHWLTTSKIGKEEALAINNHGTFYDLACVVISKFVNEPSVLEERKGIFSEYRIHEQIKEDGSMPLELKRTKSLSYLLMGLKGLIELSHLYGDLEHETINKAISWVVDNGFNKTWTYTQVTEFDQGIWLLYQDVIKDYDQKWQVINKVVNKEDVINKTLWYLHKK